MINTLEQDIEQGSVSYGRYKLKKVIEDKDVRDRISTSDLFRDKMFGEAHDKWNKAEDVGSIMDAIWNLPDDATNEDWEDYYFANVRDYGKINYHIERMARAENLGFNTAANYWWIYILDNTYKGWKNEQIAKAEIKKYIASTGKDLTVRHSTPEVDKTMAVDLEVVDSEGKVICGAQVKEAGYFYSKKSSVVNARNWNKKKYAKYTAAFNAPVWEINITDTIANKELSWKKVEY